MAESLDGGDPYDFADFVTAKLEELKSSLLKEHMQQILRVRRTAQSPDDDENSDDLKSTEILISKVQELEDTGPGPTAGKLGASSRNESPAVSKQSDACASMSAASVLPNHAAESAEDHTSKADHHEPHESVALPRQMSISSTVEGLPTDLNPRAHCFQCGSPITGDVPFLQQISGGSHHQQQKPIDRCRCGSKFAVEDRFCGRCGERRYLNLCACGAFLADDANFCKACGEPVPRPNSESYSALEEVSDRPSILGVLKSDSKGSPGPSRKHSRRCSVGETPLQRNFSIGSMISKSICGSSDVASYMGRRKSLESMGKKLGSFVEKQQSGHTEHSTLSNLGVSDSTSGLQCVAEPESCFAEEGPGESDKKWTEKIPVNEKEYLLFSTSKSPSKSPSISTSARQSHVQDLLHDQEHAESHGAALSLPGSPLSLPHGGIVSFRLSDGEGGRQESSSVMPGIQCLHVPPIPEARRQLTRGWEEYLARIDAGSTFSECQSTGPNSSPMGIAGGFVHMDTESLLNAEHSSRRSVRCFVVPPTSLLRSIWDMASVLFMIHDVIAMPLQFFELQESFAVQMLLWITRIFWTLDVLMNFMSGFTKSDGEDELRFLEIARRYASTWLAIDLTAVLVEWLTLLPFSSNSDLLWIRAVRAVRMIRLLRLVRAPAKLEIFFDSIRSERHTLWARTVGQMLAFILGAHVLGCGWFGLGSTSNHGWVSEVQNELGDKDKGFLYAMSYHWALTNFASAMETHPQNLAERIYAVSVLVSAFFMSVMLVSSLTSSMTQLQFIKSNQIAQAATLRRFLFEAGISHHLKSRVQANASFNLKKKKQLLGESDVELLEHVSPALRSEIRFEMYFPVIALHPLFRILGEFCPTAARQICHTATSQMSVSRGDLLFSQGETPAVAKMIFVCDGLLLYSKERLTLASMHQSTRIQSARVQSTRMSMETRKTQASIMHTSTNGAQERGYVAQGEWCCEPAAWLDWTFGGMLLASSESDLLLVDSVLFRNIVSKFKILAPIVGHYARNYVAYMNQDPSIGDLSHGKESSLLPIELMLEERRVSKRHSVKSIGSSRRSWSQNSHKSDDTGDRFNGVISQNAVDK